MTYVQGLMILLRYGWIFLCSLPAAADVIYQWTDPWGQVKYSKTPVSGSMISELTELPLQQEFTEQQKQQAMLRKKQQIKQSNFINKQKKAAAEYIRLQNKKNENHCRKLRNILTEAQLRDSRTYYYLDNYYSPGAFFYPQRPFYPGGYDDYLDYPYAFMTQELNREIRDYCR